MYRGMPIACAASLPAAVAAAVVVALVVAPAPAHADVLTVELDKDVFSISDRFTVSGTVSDSERVGMVVSIKGPSAKIPIMNTISNADGTYSFLPRAAKDVFKFDGTYVVNVFTDRQASESGTTIKVKRDGDSIMLVPDFVLELKKIGNKQVYEAERLSFVAGVTDSSTGDAEYGLENQPPGAAIGAETGAFSWTPAGSQRGGHVFDVVVRAGPLEDRETIVVTVLERPAAPPAAAAPDPAPAPAPPTGPTADPGIAPFVDPAEDPQAYVDRYGSEDAYREWFDTNYPQYDSIYQAVGLEGPPAVPAPFVDPSEDPQAYVDRYGSEDAYREWFDTNYPQYDSIYQAVGLEGPPPADAADRGSEGGDRGEEKPPVPLAPFVDPSEDPQAYVDRYGSEDAYREWFDTNYPQYDSIYQAVGLAEPGEGGAGTAGPGRDAPESGECGPGTDLVDGVCVIVGGGKVQVGGGGGCLIATAAYGSETAPQVQFLREVRDNQLMNTASGKSFMAGFNQLYYSFSPGIADMQRESPALKEAVRIAIAPLLMSLGIMSHAGSEAEVVAYGTGVILMNVGIYLAAPAAIIAGAAGRLRGGTQPKKVNQILSYG